MSSVMFANKPTNLAVEEVPVRQNEWSDFERLWMEVCDAFKNRFQLSEDMVEKAVERMKQCFHQDHSYNEFSEIDFDQMVNCAGYVNRFTICNTALAEFAAKEFLEKAPKKIIEPLLECREIRIACAGGGPGSDLIGFITAFLRKRKEHTKSTLKLHATVTDRYKGWEKVLEEMKTIIRSASYKPICDFDNVDFDADFLEVDITSGYRILRKLHVFQKVDVILMVKLLSILSWQYRHGAIKAVQRNMKPGAILLIVDTGLDSIGDDICCHRDMKIIFRSRKRMLSMKELPHCYTAKSSFEICVVKRLNVTSAKLGSQNDEPPSKRRRSESGSSTSKS